MSTVFSGIGIMLVVALSSLFVRFHSVSLQVTFAVFVTFTLGINARDLITNVTLVPFSILPMYHILVSLLYELLFASMNSTSGGNKSYTETFVAFDPFPALLTVMVQMIVSFTKYSSFSTVLLIDTSVYGCGVIVSLTVMFSPLGAISVMLLVKLPSAFTLTLTTIVAFVYAGISVMFHFITRSS